MRNSLLSLSARCALIVLVLGATALAPTASAASCAHGGRAFFFDQAGAPELVAATHTADPDECLQYYFHMIAVRAPGSAPGDPKTWPRGRQALGPTNANQHALAEFHWASWEKVLPHDNPTAWHNAGVEFRRRMVARGYIAGDTWAIQELPSSLPTHANQQQNLIALARGLYDGPNNQPLGGVIFNIGGDPSTDLERWFHEQDVPGFWSQLAPFILTFGQEAYLSCGAQTCNGATVNDMAAAVNRSTERVARLAHGTAAEAFMDSRYYPVMTAVWPDHKGSGYGGNNIPLGEMERFVRLQVYATLRWAHGNPHQGPDRRIGFAWFGGSGRGVPEAQERQLASTLANSIRAAYVSDQPVQACGPGGLPGCNPTP